MVRVPALALAVTLTLALATEASAQFVASVELTPRAATNQVNTQHTVTATVRNNKGQPVQGADVDFKILAGPNAGLAQAGMTDAVTNASGQVSFAYTSNATGTDTIHACTETGGTENDTCSDSEFSDTAHKTWQAGPVTTTAVVLDMDADDGNTTNSSFDNGCRVTTAGPDEKRESAAQNVTDPTRPLSPANFQRICAAAFQSGGRIAGARINFAISGAGRVFAAREDDLCDLTSVPPQSASVDVVADRVGRAHACLYSTEGGHTDVTASSGSPAQSAAGTVDWTMSPSSARYIQLCHGDAVVPLCDPTASSERGDAQRMTARVTNRQGNPVPGVPVEFRQTGPAAFAPDGAATAVGTTDGNGSVTVEVRSEAVGQSAVVAEINPEAAPGTFRVGGPGNDECEGPPGEAPAGNCVSQRLVRSWQDTTRPALTAVSLLRRVFAVDTRGAAETSVAARAKRGTAFLYTLSEAGSVTFLIEQAVAGRRVGKRCVKPTRSNRTRKPCTRYARAGAFAQQSPAGPSSKSFSGRIGKRTLRPGRYRATLTAHDASGNASVPVQLSLRVAAR